MRLFKQKLTLWIIDARRPGASHGPRRSHAGPGPKSRRTAAAAAHGFDLSDLDTTCKACDNFFQYANGGWIARNPIQPAYPSWGRFNALQEHNQEVLRKILEAAAASKSAPGSIEQKIGDFYASCMDEKRIEAQGAKPLQPELERIAKISSLPQLENEVSLLHSRGRRRAVSTSVPVRTTRTAPR